MRRKSINLIIGSMTFALLGVMALQYYFIRQSYLQQSQLFDQSVIAALSHVASKAERNEVLEYSLTIEKQSKKRFQRERDLQKQVNIQEEIDQIRKELFSRQQDYQKQEEGVLRMYPHAVHIDNSFYETYINQAENRHLIAIDVGFNRAGVDGQLIQENYIEVRATKNLPMHPSKDDSVRFLLLTDINPLTQAFENEIVTLPPPTDKTLERRLAALERESKLFQANSLMDTVAILGGKNPKLVEDFAISVELSQRPFEDRIDLEFIQDELVTELQSRDINAPFYLEVRENDDVLFTMANDGAVRTRSNEGYAIPLFREDIVRSNGELRMYIPSKDKLLLSNIRATLFSSIALLLVLTGAFAYTLITIFRQKKVSEMKTDFINNMTHEFKTPVATIMIASESLRDPEIVEDKGRVARLANIIYDENVRLGNHIERVLNIAQIEKEDLRLVMKELEVDRLITGVKESMELQFQKHGALLDMTLDADGVRIIGDELHFSNVIYNLLDNALKYGAESPEIRIHTKHTGQSVHVFVKDNGIGMGKDQLSRIFDQFYRIPTGNRHDVKGFGLGLSYVADIVRRMKGKIHVRSEKGKGSTFELVFPVINRKE